jgi:PIN domain nuclease of toxin-antitoxin system
LRLLLDSHVLVWWLEGDDRLSERAREAIGNPETALHFSSASVWELEIKQAKGKLKLPEVFLETLIAQGVVEIAVSSLHAIVAGGLPPHHDDPFDRMLVAQAQAQGLTIVTRDRRIAAYGVPVLW